MTEVQLPIRISLILAFLHFLLLFLSLFPFNLLPPAMCLARPPTLLQNLTSAPHPEGMSSQVCRVNPAAPVVLLIPSIVGGSLWHVTEKRRVGACPALEERDKVLVFAQWLLLNGGQQPRKGGLILGWRFRPLGLYLGFVSLLGEGIGVRMECWSVNIVDHG